MTAALKLVPSPSPGPKATDVVRDSQAAGIPRIDREETSGATATERRCPVCLMSQMVDDKTGLFMSHLGRFDKLCSYSDKEWVDPVEAELERRAVRRAADARSLGGRQLTVTTAADIKPRRVRWAWENRVSLGGLTLIAGRESGGKSTVTYERVARITRGQLEGELHGKPRSVVVVATEDSWENTIVPRLMAAGADLTRVLRVGVQATDFGSYELSLPEDIPALEDVFKQHEVALMVLDPLMSRLGRKPDGREIDTHKDSDVRVALEPLVALADRSGVTALGIIHVNKSGSTDPLTSVMGSRAFAAVARAVLFVVRDGDDRLLCFPKSNLGPEQRSIKFRIETKEVGRDPYDGQPIPAGAIVWTGEDDRSARDVLEEQAAGKRRKTRDRAEEWLAARLKDGPASFTTLRDEAKKEGIAERTLRRASRELYVTVETSGFPARSTWSLPVGDL